MNRMWLAGLLPLLLAAPPGRAQDSKPADTVPAPTNIQGQQYPRIHPDLRVTFRIKAPDAQKVVFGFFDSQRYPAKKGEDGFWTATTEPQVPGFHYYRVFIDGAEVNDPASQTFYGTGKDASGIEIPEKGVDFYLPKDVPHGEVRERWYFSKTTQDVAAHLRLHPARLRQRSRHAVSGAVPAARRRRGRDGLAEPGARRLHPGQPDRRAEGEADDRGHGAGLCASARRAGPRTPSAGAAGRARAESPPRPDFSRMFSAFEEVMVKDLIPMIDATYRTIPDREHRAMAGLSMGGMQTFQITLKHLDLFAYIGGFSGGGGGFGGVPFDPKTAHNGVMADADEFNKKVRLLWLGIGTAEPKRMYEGIKNYHEALEKAGIKHVYYESPGTAHEWLTWRRCLHEFAPLLFANASDSPAGPAGGRGGRSC